MFLKMKIGKYSEITNSGTYSECYEAFMQSVRTLQTLYSLNLQFFRTDIEAMTVKQGKTLIEFSIEER